MLGQGTLCLEIKSNQIKSNEDWEYIPALKSRERSISGKTVRKRRGYTSSGVVSILEEGTL